MKELTQIGQYQFMESKLRQAADAEANPMMREKLLVQADAWHLLAKASRSEEQAV